MGTFVRHAFFCSFWKPSSLSRLVSCGANASPGTSWLPTKAGTKEACTRASASNVTQLMHWGRLQVPPHVVQRTDLKRRAMREIWFADCFSGAGVVTISNPCLDRQLQGRTVKLTGVLRRAAPLLPLCFGADLIVC